MLSYLSSLVLISSASLSLLLSSSLLARSSAFMMLRDWTDNTCTKDAGYRGLFWGNC